MRFLSRRNFLKSTSLAGFSLFIFPPLNSRELKNSSDDFILKGIARFELGLDFQLILNVV